MKQHLLLITLLLASFKLTAQYVEDVWNRSFINENRVDTQLITEPSGSYFISKSSVVSIPEHFIEEEYSVFTKNVYLNGNLISRVIYDNMKPLININSWVFVRDDTGQINMVEEGYWIAHFINGNIQYKGNYIKGRRTGVWEWYYTNGKLKMLIDYKSNEYKHFDSTGSFVTEYNDELLTLFAESAWYSTQGIGDKSIVLYTKKNEGPTIDELIYHFNYNNTYSIDYRLMSSMQNGEPKQSYNIIADTLLIESPINKHKFYNYKIMKKLNSRIVLNRVTD